MLEKLFWLDKGSMAIEPDMHFLPGHFGADMLLDVLRNLLPRLIGTDKAYGHRGVKTKGLNMSSGFLFPRRCTHSHLLPWLLRSTTWRESRRRVLACSALGPPSSKVAMIF